MSGKARKLGSSRRLGRPERQAEDVNMQTPQLDKEPFSSEVMEKVQAFFQECDEDNKGFITREDMQKVKSNFLYSPGELEILFDGLDNDRKGYLTTEEFTTGLRNFVQSQDITKEQRRKRLSSKRMQVRPMLLSLEEADEGERQHFMSFMEHLGANNIFEDESEIWKLWAKLRHDEPYLLDNLEEFLAKVTNQIKEARKEKQMLELTLKKRIAEHNEEVQQLYEEMERQINKEKARLRTESDARSNFQSKEMKKSLDFKENDIQHLVVVQNELETQLHNLRRKQQVTNSENEQLKRTNQGLEDQLERIRQQLFEAQDHLLVMRNKASHQQSKEKRDTVIAEESKGLHDTQGIQHKQTPDKEDMESAPALQPPTEDPLSHNPVETLPQLATHASPDVTEAEPAPRTRVISIEEDPLPEPINEEAAPGLNDFPDQSVQQMAPSSLEMVPNNWYEMHKQQVGDLGPQGDMPLQAHMHSEDSRQDTRLNRETPEHDILQDVPKRAVAKINVLVHSYPEPVSEPGTPQKTHKKQIEEMTEHNILEEIHDQSERERDTLVHSTEQPISKLGKQLEHSGQPLVEMVKHDHIAHGEDLNWAHLESEVLVHSAEDPRSEVRRPHASSGQPLVETVKHDHIAHGEDLNWAHLESEVLVHSAEDPRSEVRRPHASSGQPLVETAKHDYIVHGKDLNWAHLVHSAEKPRLEVRSPQGSSGQPLAETAKHDHIVHGEDFNWAHLESEVLVHSAEKPRSEVRSPQGSSGQPLAEMAKHDHIVHGKDLNWAHLESEVLVHSAEKPRSEVRSPQGTSGQPLVETAKHDHIVHGEDLNWAHLESEVLVHSEEQPDSEQEPQYNLTIQAMPDMYTLFWDVAPPVVQENNSTAQSTDDSRTAPQVSNTDDILPQDQVLEGAPEKGKGTPGNRGRKKVTFKASVLERFCELGIQAEEETPLHEKKECLKADGLKKGDLESKEGTDTSRAQQACMRTGSAENLSEGTSTLSVHVRHNPDHVYKVLFVGNSNVGKSSFLYRVHDDVFRTDIQATIGMDYRIKTLIVDNKCFALQMWDTAGQERYHSITKQFFRKADGIVVMYDVTSAHSFTAVRYWLDCIQEVAGDGVLILLLGNKIDCTSERQVSTNEGGQLAEKYRLLFHECSAAADINITPSIIHLARSLKQHEDRLKNMVVTIPTKLEKKHNCCT